MAVATRLTWMQEKKLRKSFLGKQLSLLYKATVQNFSVHSLLPKCCDQEHILIVVYTKDHVIGAYIHEGFQQQREVPITIFVLRETGISEFTRELHIPSALFPTYYCGNTFHICLKQKTVTIPSGTTEKLGLPQCNAISIEECEVFRIVARNYKPYGDLVQQIRILLLGPTGAGKSSFVNSVKSIFQGHVTHQALVGSKPSGITKKYRIYSIKDGKDGNLLPLTLCDSMGLGEEGEGLCMGDIISILKGHVPDGYQFNSIKPIAPGHSDYINNPSLKDRIHYVAFVLDANSVEDLSPEMITKIKHVQRVVIKCGVLLMALLTNVDSLDLVTETDLSYIYQCMPVKSKVDAVHRKLGFALNDILVVSNYSSERELDSVRDVLILSVLRQIMWATDDYLKDLPCDDMEI
ncbi:Interferon-induced protein 44 [Galemys pyrenaicus]|uniref:Interferon-induced protein 44 n=1 Tax=Galemys pyrenaicus TaxID=202257 RepID=A0A8J5ZUQ3_GALPY|nr:Interferon-induced protein 44 [Galemys pyrenaicus]